MNDRFLQFLSLVKGSGKLIEGYSKCEDIIKKKSVFLIILSYETSQNTKDKFKGFAERLNIPVIEDYRSEVLGNSIGRPEINVLCVVDKNMARKLLEVYEALKNNRG